MTVRARTGSPPCRAASVTNPAGVSGVTTEAGWSDVIDWARRAIATGYGESSVWISPSTRLRAARAVDVGGPALPEAIPARAGAVSPTPIATTAPAALTRASEEGPSQRNSSAA